jgi:hypothetical protein
MLKSVALASGFIGFQLNAKVRGAIFNPARPEGLRFDAGGPFSVDISLRPSSNDVDGFGRDGLDYTIRAQLPASGEAIAFVRALVADRYEPFGKPLLTLPLIVGDRQLIASDGAIQTGFFLRREMMPYEVQQILNEVESFLENIRDRFLSQLRWRQGAAAADKLVEHSSLYWRTDPGVGYLVPRKLSHPVSAPAARKGFRWGPGHEAGLLDLWSRGVDEPFSHELIREAQTLVEQSPRSAFLIATSAAEAGIKLHLSKVVPNVAWLLEEAPSPPIFKLLRDYVPAVNAAAGRDVAFWEKFKPRLKDIQVMVEARNKIAHTGRMPEDIDVQSTISNVRDLLYVLDVLDGEDWAKLLVSEDLARQLSWPPRQSEEPTLLFEWSQPDDEAIRRLLNGSVSSGKT